MTQLDLPSKVKDTLEKFTQRLKTIYGQELVSVILYGSGSSSEFVDRHSNLNLLVVLKSTDLKNLKQAAHFASSFKFRMISPLFFTEDYIANSLDVFPIEFLDLRENSRVLWGKDIFRDIYIDTRNLRFQCEHELKARLLRLKQQYVILGKDKLKLKDTLLGSFTSVLHILRNVLRFKDQAVPYLKAEVLKALALHFKINQQAWEKILAAKNKQIKLKAADTDALCSSFIEDLERIVDAVDKL